MSGESIDPRRKETCPECRKRPVRTNGLCSPCYKRLIWRPRGGPAQEHALATARAWKAEHPEAVRRYAESRQGQCVDCGGSTSYSDRDERCRPCSIEHRRAIAHARYEDIERRWNAGESLKEIGAALGTTANSAQVTIHTMRKAGWNVPYRYKAYERKATA